MTFFSCNVLFIYSVLSLSNSFTWHSHQTLWLSNKRTHQCFALFCFQCFYIDSIANSFINLFSWKKDQSITSQWSHCFIAGTFSRSLLDSWWQHIFLKCSITIGLLFTISHLRYRDQECLFRVFYFHYSTVYFRQNSYRWNLLIETKQN